MFCVLGIKKHSLSFGFFLQTVLFPDMFLPQADDTYYTFIIQVRER